MVELYQMKFKLKIDERKKEQFIIRMNCIAHI